VNCHTLSSKTETKHWYRTDETEVRFDFHPFGNGFQRIDRDLGHGRCDALPNALTRKQSTCNLEWCYVGTSRITLRDQSQFAIPLKNLTDRLLSVDKNPWPLEISNLRSRNGGPAKLP
jgi:hypothetical protein